MPTSGQKSANFQFSFAKRYPDLGAHRCSLRSNYFTFDPIRCADHSSPVSVNYWRSLVAARSGLLDGREGTTGRSAARGFALRQTTPREVLDLFHQIRVDGKCWRTHRRDGDPREGVGVPQDGSAAWYLVSTAPSMIANFQVRSVSIPPRPHQSTRTAELCSRTQQAQKQRGMLPFTEAQRAKEIAAEAKSGPTRC